MQRQQINIIIVTNNLIEVVKIKIDVTDHFLQNWKVYRDWDWDFRTKELVEDKVCLLLENTFKRENILDETHVFVTYNTS